MFSSYNDHRTLHSFPTRRSSDLQAPAPQLPRYSAAQAPTKQPVQWGKTHGLVRRDRKSTRLNSSHVESSYAVFCLKKKRYGYSIFFFVFSRLSCCSYYLALLVIV